MWNFWPLSFESIIALCYKLFIACSNSFLNICDNYMSTSGFFITLFDRETLKLYLNKGIYGFHMPPIYGEVPLRSKHYAALADYGCAREGTHVFFFLKREIIYGGQIIGSKEYGSFYLNGIYSPLGRNAKAELFWDESFRTCYSRTEQEGIFVRPNINETKVCQPYILLFEDKLGLAGKVISSDQLYFNIGKYPFPLPTNSISGMGFCTMTPFETNIALELLQKESIKSYEFRNYDEVDITGDKTPYHPRYDIKNLNEAINESHLEASVLSNPYLLKEELRPDRDTTLCRQVPISPFKPFQMDRADICYYKDSFSKGALPFIIIELKNKSAGRAECEQTERYLKWLKKCAPDESKNIDIYLIAPGFKRTASVSREFRNQIHLEEI